MKRGEVSLEFLGALLRHNSDSTKRMLLFPHRFKSLGLQHMLLMRPTRKRFAGLQLPLVLYRCSWIASVIY